MQATKETENRIEYRNVSLVAVLLSDIHFPFHDPTALRLALQVVALVRPDLVILNGDTQDFYGVSRFFKEPERRVGFRYEIYAIRKLKQLLFQRLREAAPGARLIEIEGNHEYRLTTWLASRGEELYDLDVLDVPVLTQNPADVTYLRRRRDPGPIHDGVAPEILLGGLHVTHGDLLRAGSYTINIARSLYLKLQTPFIIGHWHRTDEYHQTDYEGKLHGFWVTGCLCLPRPAYDAGRLWGQGVAIVRLHADNMYQVIMIPFIPQQHGLVAFIDGATLAEEPSRPRPHHLIWRGDWNYEDF